METQSTAELPTSATSSEAPPPVSLTDRAAVMAQGRVQHTGTPEEIREVLGGAYLGAAS